MASTVLTRSGDSPGRNDLVGLSGSRSKSTLETLNKFPSAGEKSAGGLVFGCAVMISPDGFAEGNEENKDRFSACAIWMDASLPWFSSAQKISIFRVTASQISRSTSVNGQS
jgi:hypothetical protein